MSDAKKAFVVEPISYHDGKEWRIVDLRPDGVDCIPLLASGSFNSVRSGVDMHIHPGHVEICLYLKGNVRYETTEGEIQVLPDRIFVSKPNELHRRCNNPKGMLAYRILFAPPGPGGTILGLSVRESAALSRGITEFPFRLCPSSARVRAAFERLLSLYESEKRGTVLRRLKMKSAALELLLSLAELPGLPPSPHGRPNAKVKAIVKRMEDEPERNYPVEELAAEAALSTVAFTDAFKRATGFTPHAYLIDVRIRRARELLANSAISVSAVANRFRFPSPQHFATVFRRITGFSPSECRHKSD
jgi:AraC-like DNA-binding protein